MNLPMIDCKIVPVNLLLNNSQQNLTHHKKYLRNNISDEDCKKKLIRVSG